MKKLKELQNLSGRTALITGGAGYLGTAMSETIAELGGNVLIASRSTKGSIQLTERLTKEYAVKSRAFQIDITNPESIKQVYLKIEQEFGCLDILINNAWSGNKNTFESINYDDWKYDIDVCLNGVFNSIKELIPLIKKAECGIILNVASMYGHVAPDYRLYDGKKYANPPSYGAAKAGVIQLTKYLASFLSEDKIRVNALSPGAYPFPQTQEDGPEFVKKLTEKAMLGRIGTPDDLKGAIALLCTDASKFMTGQNICVDGGWTIW